MKRLVVLGAAIGIVALVRHPDAQSPRGASAALVPGMRAEPTHTVWDSVFTDSQAVRGDTLYRATCQRCHGATLMGSADGNPLTGPDFQSNWNGQTVYDLYDRVRTSMPSDNPKTVPREQIPDLLAFVLSQNHFPSGAKVLPDDPDKLKDIKFVTTKP
jgi:mono/diheme cytochrome c family protein